MLYVGIVSISAELMELRLYNKQRGGGCEDLGSEVVEMNRQNRSNVFPRNRSAALNVC